MHVINSHPLRKKEKNKKEKKKILCSRLKVTGVIEGDQDVPFYWSHGIERPPFFMAACVVRTIEIPFKFLKFKRRKGFLLCDTIFWGFNFETNSYETFTCGGYETKEFYFEK